MKFLKYLLTAITCIAFVSACQKELSFDVDGLARGTLKFDVTGECLPSTVNGIFRADSVLDNTNFIDVQVNLTTTGTYDIKSDTVNGYSFRGTGNFGVTGLNMVRLYGSGKPLFAGTDAFTIIFDSTNCAIDVTVIGLATGPAVYTLSGAPNACSGAIVSGTYTEATALDISNTVTLKVDVTAPGTYALAAATVNGMLFTSTGVFGNTGIQSVTLNGVGMPLAAGPFNLTASNGSSNCTFSITVQPSGGGGPAIYTLNGAPGACTGAVSAGTYTVATALTAANTVTLNVTVATIGTYSITTNTSNGMSFTASGSFTTTGPQPVVLTGTGTPAAAGASNFTGTAVVSTCTFSITVTGAAPPPNTDYIPETAFSNWSDKLVGGVAGDTSYIQVSANTVVRNGVTYKIFELKDVGTPYDSILHRKNGGLYYQLYDDDYGFDNPFNAEGLLLDSNLAINATWNTNLGSNSISGTPVTVNIDAKIIDKGAAVTIAGNTYTNVIKVTYTYNYNLGAGSTAFAVEEVWYAKGKGTIYDKINDVPVTVTEVWETTRTQIF